MTKDRLADLKAAQGEEHDFVPNETNRFMDEFFTEVEEIGENLDKIRTNVEEIKMKHNTILSSPRVDQKIKQELEALMADTNQTAKLTRVKLKVMKHKIEGNDSSADARIKKTQHDTLLFTFAEVMTDYNETQIEYKEKYKSLILRQREIIGKSTTAEELDDMLENGNLRVFTEGIITETQQAKQTLSDIEARHNDIIKLEKNIREVHDLFMDLAIMVQSQGEVIDQIEYNVVNTEEYTASGKDQLRKAREHKKKSRRKKIIIILCLVVLVAVISLIIAVSYGLQ